MTTAGKELQLATAFGPSLADAILLAHQVDESEQDEGHQRSFVVRVDASGAKITDTLDHPAYQSWRSSNGTAYTTSNKGGLWVHDGANWTRERVCDEQVQLDAIWGFAGPTPAEDILLVTTDESLYVRSNGVWQTHEVPVEAEMVSRLHGLTATEVYVTTANGLWQWNGKVLQPVEGPEGDLSGVRVLSADEVFVTEDDLFRRTTASGWKALQSPAGDGHTVAMEIFGGQVFVGTLSGVLHVLGDVASLVTEVFCNQLADVGDHLIAAGDKVLLFDGARWRPLALPVLSPGQKP